MAFAGLGSVLDHAFKCAAIRDRWIFRFYLRPTLLATHSAGRANELRGRIRRRAPDGAARAAPGGHLWLTPRGPDSWKPILAGFAPRTCWSDIAHQLDRGLRRIFVWFDISALHG